MANQRQDTCFKLVVSTVTTEHAQQGKESYRGRGFLTLEENNNGKDSRKKTTKKKRQDKKPLLAGYSGFRALLLATQTRDRLCYSLPDSFLDFSGNFSLISWKRKLFGAWYPLDYYILKQLFSLLSVKSGRYLPHRFAAWQISTTIHLHYPEFEQPIRALKKY